MNAAPLLAHGSTPHRPSRGSFANVLMRAILGLSVTAASAMGGTLEIYGATSPGGIVSVSMKGNPSSPGLLLVGAPLCPPLATSIGTLHVDLSAPFLQIGIPSLGPTGAVTFAAMLPATPSLIGTRLQLQALVPGLTNATALWIHDAPTLVSGAAGDQLGLNLEAADLDGDGADEILAAAIQGASGAGEVRIAGGAQMAPLATLSDPTPQSGGGFGSAIAAGDVFGGPAIDVVVGASFAGAVTADQTGEAWLFAGPGLSSATALTPPVPEVGSGFGAAIAIGDFDGDGARDVAIGAPGATSFGLPLAGRVFVFHGPTLTIVTAIDSPSATVLGLFGASLASGDVDGDGRDELVVGAPNMPLGALPEVGCVFVFDDLGAAGVTTLTDPHPSSFAAMGFKVRVADLIGDGRLDVLVSVPGGQGTAVQNPSGIARVGEVLIFDGATNVSPITLFDPTPVFFEHFAMSVDAGDVDGDGVLDVIVGGSLTDQGPTQSAGEVHIFLGPTFKVRLELSASLPIAGAQLGVSVRAADVDGDGDREVVAGQPFAGGGAGGYLVIDG